MTSLMKRKQGKQVPIATFNINCVFPALQHPHLYLAAQDTRNMEQPREWLKGKASKVFAVGPQILRPQKILIVDFMILISLETI